MPEMTFKCYGFSEQLDRVKHTTLEQSWSNWLLSWIQIATPTTKKCTAHPQILSGGLDTRAKELS